MSQKIIICSGDPRSINSEIIYKCWKKLNNSIRKKLYIISNYDLIKKQFKILNYKINLTKIDNINQITKTNKLKIININLKFKDPFKIPINLSSEYVLESLDRAHKYALRKDVLGIINCPINKNLLKKDNFGVTEYLAAKNKIKKNSEVMLIRNKSFSVSPLTTHADIKRVSKNLSAKIIIDKIKTIHYWYKKSFNIKPKIGVTGLNPHNAELRKNSEEVKIIIPAIKKLKKLNIRVKGPLVTDTLFINDYKKFDVIVGMYHDQVLAPFKSLYKFDAINVTLGLRYLRLSPDHGTSENLIGKKKAKETSLMRCIEFVNTLKK